MNNRKFLTAIISVGRMHDRQVDEFALSIYDGMADRHGEDVMLRVLGKWVTERDRFPMPANLSEFVSPRVDNRERAVTIAHSLSSLIRFRGWTWTQWLQAQGTPFAIAFAHDMRERKHTDTEIAAACAIIEYAGGWSVFVRQYDAGETPQAHSQLRDTLVGMLAREERDETARAVGLLGSHVRAALPGGS